MNALIYCENGNLTIRKPNGLEWQHEQVDKPELGFEYDVLVYDDIECKVEKWVENVPLEEQEGIFLIRNRKRFCKLILITEPPMGVSLNTQYINRVGNVVRSNEETQCIKYGFDNMVEVLINAKKVQHTHIGQMQEEF